MSVVNQGDIGFFYPTRNVGGAQYLFARMAEYLIDHTSYKIVLIDYADGFIRKKLADKDYHFIEYRDDERIVIREPLLLILSLSFLSLITKKLVLPEATRLFFWDLHPYNLVEQFALSGLYKIFDPRTAHRICTLVERSRCRKLACFVEQSAEKHGIAFMAQHNRDYNQQLLDFSAQVDYLPLPMPAVILPADQSQKRVKVDSTIHVGWLSRLDSWKAAVLFRLIDDIKAWNLQDPGSIHLHVIGDGSERERIQAKCNADYVTMTGKLEGNALTDYVLTNIDIGFAMGTAALEFAVRGIPTVLTPARVTSQNRRCDKIYRWLFDSQGYDVTAEEGRRIDGLRSFSEIIVDFQNDTTGALEERCRNYVVKYHDIRSVGAMLGDTLSKCTLTYGDLQRLGLYQYSPTEQFLFRLKDVFKRVREVVTERLLASNLRTTSSMVL